VDHPADRREPAVQHEVGRGVRGWVQVALDDRPVLERHEDDVLRSERVVGHAAGLDRHDPGIPVDAARVAERERDEAGGDELAVGAADLLAEEGERHAITLRRDGDERIKPWANGEGDPRRGVAVVSRRTYAAWSACIRMYARDCILIVSL